MRLRVDRRMAVQDRRRDGSVAVDAFDCGVHRADPAVRSQCLQCESFPKRLLGAFLRVEAFEGQHVPCRTLQEEAQSAGRVLDDISDDTWEIGPDEGVLTAEDDRVAWESDQDCQRVTIGAVDAYDGHLGVHDALGVPPEDRASVR